jgi:hypothetical protein
MYSQDEVDMLTFEDDHLREHQLPIELLFSPVHLETQFADEMLELTEKNRKDNVSTHKLLQRLTSTRPLSTLPLSQPFQMVLILFCHHNHPR